MKGLFVWVAGLVVIALVVIAFIVLAVLSVFGVAAWAVYSLFERNKKKEVKP